MCNECRSEISEYLSRLGQILNHIEVFNKNYLSMAMLVRYLIHSKS